MTTQNDRQQFELAAKAAGIEWTDGPNGEMMVAPHVKGAAGYRKPWNPRGDDGDALRLAAALNITVGFDTLPDGAIVYTSAEWHDEWDQGFRIMEWLGKDAAAATRRAIFRAVVEIGKAMK